MMGMARHQDLATQKEPAGELGEGVGAENTTQARAMAY